MKKLLIGTIAVLLCLCLVTPLLAISITVDGNKLSFDEPPTNVNGRILVPLRTIFEALGATVNWNGEKQEITANRENTSIVLYIDKNNALVNNQPIILDVPPKNINGRTMVPTRFIAECLGAEVEWDGAFNTVRITSNRINENGDNGLIIEQNKIEEKDGIQTYKIKYMSGGLKVVGYIIRPVPTGEKYPIIIFNRGGNREYEKIDQNKINYLKKFVQAGYIVLASQYRGNDGGEGQDEFGGEDVDDVLNIIKVGQEISDADKNNVVMYGVSRGGQMTYQAIKQNAPIKAACVVSTGSDWFDAYERGDIDVLNELVGDPINEKEKYLERSPYYWPDSINKPVLILHGERDERALVTEMAKLAKKLVGLGKDVKYRVFPDGVHGLNNLQDDRDRMILSWFNYHTNKASVDFNVYDGIEVLNKYLNKPYDIYGTYLIPPQDLEKVINLKNLLITDQASMSVFGKFFTESKFSTENGDKLIGKNESSWIRFSHAMSFKNKRFFLVYVDGSKSINGCSEKIFKYNYAELVETTKSEGEYFKVIREPDMTVIVYGAKDLNTLEKMLAKYDLDRIVE